MLKEFGRVILLGPPASGKSRLGAHLKMLAQTDVPHLDLDKVVLELAKKYDVHGPLSDEFIDEATAAFLARIPEEASCIAELPHHDYIRLIGQNFKIFKSFDIAIVLMAPLTQLLRRDVSRMAKVPPQYIARCVGSALGLCEYLATSKLLPWIKIDSSLLSPSQQASLASDVIRRDVSASLSLLAIAPEPGRPDLGGHLRDTIEWDQELVRGLVKHFNVRTVLDVGCGSGLSIDAFADLGVTAWGIEGNSQILSGPSRIRERLMIVDFTRQWVEWPIKADLIWCTEVLEHIAPPHEENVLRTICHNTGRLAFVSAASPGQPGYHHVNCQPQDYWVRRITEHGLTYLPKNQIFLEGIKDSGPFGTSFLRRNGMVFTRSC